MTAPRLTRRETQVRTREALMAAAREVFARHGLERGSIDEIAAAAGFTKGAFYANFASKDELLLALLDERFADRREAIERTGSSGAEPDERMREGATDFTRHLAEDREWQRLFFQFAAHAARNEPFRRELVARYGMLRDTLGEQYPPRRAEELGISLPLPVEHLALMVFAMGNGVALETLLEPDEVPEDLYAEMLELLLLGLRAKAEAAGG